MSHVLPVELETLDISVLQPCFGRPILNSGLILLQWKLMLTYRAGYTHDAVLWFTFHQWVKLYVCLFCSLNILEYHLSGNSGTFSFKTYLLTFCYLREGWRSCNCCTEESTRCFEYASCFQHLPCWAFCDTGWYHYDL